MSQAQRLELVFLLEGESEKALLESLLPRFLASKITPKYIVFEGKTDLKKRMVTRIKTYTNPNARFMVLCDKDASVCTELKRELLELCQKSGKPRDCLVRIACREIEAFYLADLLAVEKGLGLSGLEKYQSTRKYRTPDESDQPVFELVRLTEEKYTKVYGSRQIGQYLDLENERSPSFKNLIRGIRLLESKLLA
jgi:hypothetical protein